MSNTVAEAPPVLNAEQKKSVRIRWFLVGFLVLGGVVNYLDRSTLSVANLTIAEEFNLNAFQMGLLLSAFSWPYAIANLPAGYLVDKFGPKKMFAFAAGACCFLGKPFDGDIMIRCIESALSPDTPIY